MLKQLVEEKWLTANAVVGFWPANSVGDDIEVYTDETRNKRLATLHTLRQQMARDGGGRANLALADFVAPRETGLADYVGGFAVTAGIGEEDVARRFERANDDYSKIMVKALADRLAEAFAEALHEKVRRELWGYAPGEKLSNDELIAEKYAGIRPAPGYPAQPDHTEKRTLFDLLDAERATGLKLTESFAMWPAAAVSGLYLSHPEAHYFGVGKIDRDQVADYAARKGWDDRGGRALARADPQLRSEADRRSGCLRPWSPNHPQDDRGEEAERHDGHDGRYGAWEFHRKCSFPTGVWLASLTVTKSKDSPWPAPERLILRRKTPKAARQANQRLTGL